MEIISYIITITSTLNYIMEITDEILNSWVRMSKSSNIDDQTLLYNIVINNNIGDDIIILLCCTCNSVDGGFWEKICENQITWNKIQIYIDYLFDFVNSNGFNDRHFNCISCKFEKYPELLFIIQKQLSK